MEHNCSIFGSGLERWCRVALESLSHQISQIHLSSSFIEMILINTSSCCSFFCQEVSSNVQERHSFVQFRAFALLLNSGQSKMTICHWQKYFKAILLFICALLTSSVTPVYLSFNVRPQILTRNDLKPPTFSGVRGSLSRLDRIILTSVTF